jgi:hypothetical protein
MLSMSRTPAMRHYRTRTIWLALLYALTLCSAVYCFKHQLVSGPAAWIVGTLPALAIIGVFVAIGRYLVEEQDEYLRMLMVRQTLWASGFALSAATLWGFLEAFDLVGHIEPFYVAVLWFGGLGLGRCANRLFGADAAL